MYILVSLCIAVCPTFTWETFDQTNKKVLCLEVTTLVEGFVSWAVFNWQLHSHFEEWATPGLRRWRVRMWWRLQTSSGPAGIFWKWLSLLFWIKDFILIPSSQELGHPGSAGRPVTRQRDERHRQSNMMLNLLRQNIREGPAAKQSTETLRSQTRIPEPSLPPLACKWLLERY